MQRVREGLRALCSRHRIDLLYAFGSRAGEIAGLVCGGHAPQRAPRSDVDIGVLPLAGAPLDIREKSAIAIELEELLGVSRVDLVLLPEADPFLAANIIRGELLHFVDRDRADEYELYVLRWAGDLAPLERERLSLLGAAVSPSKISWRVFLDRAVWIERMVAQIGELPLSTLQEFTGDVRNVLSAESCLRRALEALFDVGRHILARGFGAGVSEYREIADGLAARGVLTPDQGSLLKLLAGYRNRLVHFYHEVSTGELYQVCSSQLHDVTLLTAALRGWFDSHQDMVDSSL
jgi:uncharacterized protein YutE (UPF0331/DUF86 family)